MNQESSRSLISLVFLFYMVGVFVLAILSNRLLRKKSFLSEYFLGSRGLGVWALAFSFAATSASGGSFTGYPSLVYSYGWVVALWIGSYMIVPPVTMGLLGKRLNQVSRRAGAITIPDVIRERFQASGLGLFASAVIVFFTLTNLVAQFKAGGIILNVLLQGTPGYSSTIIPWIEDNNLFAPILALAGPNTTGYIFGLLLFAGTVVIYTAYGGFRAVVWTDVMQGVVMGIGVLLLVPFTLAAVGGLSKATTDLNNRPSRLVLGTIQEDSAIEYRGRGTSQIRIEHRALDSSEEGPTITVDQSDLEHPIITIGLEVDEEDSTVVVTTVQETIELINETPEATRWVDVVIPRLNREGEIGMGPTPLTLDGPSVLRRGSELVFGPGTVQHGESAGSPFHPFGMAISFFFLWAISGAGQPGTMVRLMAFKDNKTLRTAIFTVTVYFGCIYLPIIFLFTSAQHLIHPAELGSGSDEIMPMLASRVAPWWLAGILIAAPFAAVMSTVDSFLLLISSAVVRDIYQRNINPRVSERTIKILSYGTTALSGVLVTLMALNPPRFLQDFIVLTGGGFAATFLGVIFLGIYWKRMTKLGAWLSMVSGFVTIVALFSPVLVSGPLRAFGIVWRSSQFNPFGLHPLVWGLFVSFGLGIGGSLISPKPPEALVRRFFGRLPQTNPQKGAEA